MRKRELKKAARLAFRNNVFLSLMTIALIAASATAALLPPLALGKIIDRLAAGAGIAFSEALRYFALLAASGLIDAARSGMITIYGQRIAKGLRESLCRKLDRLKAGYFSDHPSGSTVSRFINDVDTVATLFDEGIISLFADACKVFSILFVIFTKSRGLGIILLIVMPLLFLMTRSFQKRMFRAQLANRQAIARVSGQIPETLRSLRMIRSFGKEEYMEKRYDGCILESYRSQERSNFYDSVYSPIVVAAGSLVVAAMMVLASLGGSWQAWFGMSVGTAVTVIAYVGAIFTPLENIGVEIENIQSALAGAARISELLETEERAVPDRQPDLGQPGVPALAFRGVTFGYAPQDPVLRGFDLAEMPGDRVTLVGRTGCGKSTAVKLIFGEYEPDRGEVEVYGVRASLIADKGKRRLLGQVPQSFARVPGTVRDQLTLGDPDISEAMIARALALTGLDKLVARLERGLDTPYREADFSEGQRQLLSISRAVASDPKILLLDEMTASLDPVTEQQVTEALGKAAAQRTVLAISHRTVTDGSRTVRMS